MLWGPVKAQYIFQKTACSNYEMTHALEPLWDTFEVISLVQNHRQGKGKEYVDILNRIHKGTASEDDFNVLRSRIRPADHPDIPVNAMYVTCTNASVAEVNENRLQQLTTESAMLPAYHISATTKNFTPPPP